MVKVDSVILGRLRSMARNGHSASQMLKELNNYLPADQRSKFALIKGFREAFSLSLHEASPIGGWSADGEGEIPDDRLDAFLEPAIVRHRDEWDIE